MKASTYLLLVGLVVVNLLLTDSSVSAADNMPHYGAGGCGNHMTNPTHTTAGSYTFYLCRGTSGATVWTAYLTNSVTGVKLSGCGVTNQAVPGGGQSTFSCIVPAGSYTATIKYTVPGSSPYPHVDFYYLSP
jgi:hypothetical protein